MLPSLIAVAALSAVASASGPSVAGYTFERFEAEFGKTYATPAERALRATHFAANLARIERHNADATASWWMKVTKFADLDLAHELPRHMGYAKSSGRAAAAAPATAQQPKAAVAVADLPASVDWRDKGALTPVKNQGQCGSCWAFSATESIESHVFLATGQLLELSPQNMLECTPNPRHCGGTGGCEGATHELGFAWAQGGIALASTVPYLGKDAPCNATVPKAAHVKDFVKLPVNDGQALLAALATVGPISVTVDASEWGLYGGGIFNGCNATSPDLDHGVQAVGYGADADGNAYWLVRNSWGEGWGEQGFIRLYRGANESCGIDTKPGDGVACDGDPATVSVCGSCGIWFDTSYPIIA